MRDSVRRGIMFNIIDMERGEKADLVRLTMPGAFDEQLIDDQVEALGADVAALWRSIKAARRVGS